MVTNRELKQFLCKEIKNSINFNKIKYNTDFLSEGMDFCDFCNLIEQISINYKCSIPFRNWNNLTNISLITNYLNSKPKEVTITLDDIRNMYKRWHDDK